MATMTVTQTQTRTQTLTLTRANIQSNVTEHAITLRGSAATVSEFLTFSIQSILYQRAVYDPQSFTRTNRWGVALFTTIDPQLQQYLKRVTQQVEQWLAEGAAKRLVLVIASVDSEEVLERWAFDVSTDDAVMQHAQAKALAQSQSINANSENAHPNTTANSEPMSKKTDSQLAKEIGAVLRQITSSVSFLPLLDVACSFDLLVYTHTDIATPIQWEESDARLIEHSHAVKLRSFDTGLHAVSTTVTYKDHDVGDQ